MTFYPCPPLLPFLSLTHHIEQLVLVRRFPLQHEALEGHISPNPVADHGYVPHRDMLNECGHIVKRIEDTLARGKPYPDSMAKYLIEHREVKQLNDLDIAVMCGAFMTGGVERTSSIGQWFAAHIPACPEIHAKARAEFDSVYGRDRLPNASSSRTTWATSPPRTPSSYSTRQRKKTSPTPWNATTGPSARVCPGIALAERGVFHAVARLLWACEMDELPDEPDDLNEYDRVSGRSPVPNRI